MASAGTGGMPAPNAEDGSDELQHEQQNEDDRRRRSQELQPRRPGSPARASQQDPVSAGQPATRDNAGLDKSQPDRWQDILVARLSKLTGMQRREYDLQIYNAMEGNGTISPQYQLDLAALIAKNLPRTSYGRDLHELNRRERQARAREHAHAASATDRRRPPAEPIRASSTRIASERGSQRPAPRKAAPDRTGLVRKRLQRQLTEYAERRRELNLPPSRAEQNEFARLEFNQAAERTALRDTQKMELKLLDYQQLATRVAITAQWLARDLKHAGSAEAATYEKEALQASRAMAFAERRRANLVVQHANARDRDNAAAPAPAPTQTPQTTANQRGSAPPSAMPQASDPDLFFKEGPLLLTEDRLRAMLGRYQELREIRNMPSGLNEGDEQARVTTLQATVRKGVLVQQDKLTKLVAQKHLAERAGVAANRLAENTGQPRYRAEARRAFALARFTVERSHAIDPRARAAHDLVRSAADEHINRQTIARDASKSGRALTSDERASLPASAASSAHDRSARTSERSGGPGHDRGHGTGRGGNSRGGGRGR
jgi:hypothetical protein